MLHIKLKHFYDNIYVFFFFGKNHYHISKWSENVLLQFYSVQTILSHQTLSNFTNILFFSYFPETRNEILQLITIFISLFLNISIYARVRVNIYLHTWHAIARTRAHLYSRLSAVCTVFNYASVLKTVSLQKPLKRNDVKVQTHLLPKMFSINLPLTRGIRIAPATCDNPGVFKRPSTAVQMRFSQNIQFAIICISINYYDLINGIQTNSMFRLHAFSSLRILHV